MTTIFDRARIEIRATLRFAPAIALAVLELQSAHAQHQLLEITGPLYSGGLENGLFGWETAFLGDLDQDGYEDIGIAAPAASVLATREGAIYAYSGRTGQLLWSVASGIPSGRLGGQGIKKLGRIDGDTIPDFAVREPGGFGYQIRSGVSGSVLFTSTAGIFGFENLQPASDVDGDGRNEYAILSTSGTAPELALLSGLNHQFFWSRPVPTSAGMSFRVTRLGDVDIDGVDDYALSFSCLGSCTGGFEVWSGRTGSLLWSRAHPVPLPQMQTTVSAIGDFDGDSVPDLHFRQTYVVPYTGSDMLLYSFVHSGATGLELTSLPSNLSLAGQSVLGDLTGDGRDEYFSRANGLLIVDPSTFSSLYAIRRLPSDQPGFARSLSGEGDVDADGVSDFMLTISAAVSPIPVPGRVLVYSGAFPADSELLCFGDGSSPSGCPNCPCNNDAAAGSGGGCSNSSGSSARLFVQGVPSLAMDRTRFEIRRAGSNSAALLVSAPSALPIVGPCPAGFGVVDGLSDGKRCVGGGLLRHGARPTDSAGDLGLATPGWGAPDDPPGGILAQAGFAAGQTRYFQAFYREDPSLGCGTGVNTTNAVRLTPRP